MTHEALKALAHEVIESGMTWRALALAEGYLALSLQLEEAQADFISSDHLKAELAGAVEELSVLRAVETSRGEIVKACPRCHQPERKTSVIIGDDGVFPYGTRWMCTRCQHVYDEPACYQKVTAP